MGEPLVSVLINCFNGEKYLSQAVESVITQTYKNWEIVFWDNQSSDSSAEKFQQYAKKDDRLRYFYSSKHTLLYEARNLAIKKTRGEFIAILDADDWWHPQKLEMQIPCFKDKKVGMVYSNYWFVQDNKKKIQYGGQLPHGEILKNLLKNYCIGMVTMVIRKSIFEELNISFNKQYQIIGDFAFALSVAEKKKVNVVQEPIAYYRKHKQSLTEKELDKPITELKKWISSSSFEDNDLKYVKYNLYRRIFIRSINRKNILLSFIEILNYPIRMIFKIKLLFAGVNYLMKDKF